MKNIIDMEARNNFATRSITPCMLKCSRGFNYYTKRDKIINYRSLCEKYSRYSRKET